MSRRSIAEPQPADPPYWRFAFAMLETVHSKNWIPFLRVMIFISVVTTILIVLAVITPIWMPLAMAAGATVLTGASRRRYRNQAIAPVQSDAGS